MAEVKHGGAGHRSVVVVVWRWPEGEGAGVHRMVVRRRGEEGAGWGGQAGAAHHTAGGWWWHGWPRQEDRLAGTRHLSWYQLLELLHSPEGCHFAQQKTVE
jgi:hypothetical protein